MKRLLSCSLICLSLFVAFVTINTYSTLNFSNENFGNTSLHSSDQYFLSTPELPDGAEALKIVNIEFGSEASVTLKNIQNFLFRINRSAHLNQEQFDTYLFQYTSLRSLLHKSGYYLFRLRKILI